MQYHLSAINWFTFFEECQGVDDMYTRFIDLLTSLTVALVPPYRPSANEARLVRAVHALTSDRSGSQATANKLAKMSRRLRVIRESKLNLYDSKSFFNYANSRFRTRDPVSSLLVDGSAITDDADRADVFCSFFADVFSPDAVDRSGFHTTEGGNSPRVTAESDVRVLSPLPTFDIHESVVFEKLSALKPKCSLTPEYISPIVYKELATVIAFPLSLIFNRSLVDGIVPRLFRETFVTPVFKKGSRSQPENYRHSSMFNNGKDYCRPDVPSF